MNVLDLFSGIGAFSLGLERAGMRTVAFCEIDPFARRVLRKHWPDVPIYEDVRDLSGKRLWDDGNTSIQVICGGFPCQNVSAAAAVHGGQSGLDGEQSRLWSEYERLIRDMRPGYAIIENVDRLTRNGLDQILRALAAIGYDAEWDTLPGWIVGAPQSRQRAWIVAYPAGKRVEGLFESVRLSATRQGRQGSAPHLLDIAHSAFGGDDRFPQPLLRGMDDRPADWMDRLHALGNAVIPQIPELIGRAIMSTKHPAAFINGLSESRDLDLTIKHLQATWDDYCEQRTEIAKLRHQLHCAAQDLRDAATPLRASHAGMREALRKLAIKRHIRLTEGPRTIFNGGSCALCKAEWYEPFDSNEWHSDTCLAALSESSLPAAEGQSGWQPIETAPIDGERLILGWDDSASLPMHAEMGRFRSGTGKGSGWCNTYGHSFSGMPTHWMPLPAPPATPAPLTTSREG